MSSERSPLIAVYGFVDYDAGSVASANHLVVEELLRRGIRVDFYAIHGFIDPKGLTGRPGFRRETVSIPSVERVWRLVERLPGKARSVASLLYSQVSNALFEREIEGRINAAHQDRGYDFHLMMGGLSPFRTPGLLNVSWPQGPPDTEWEAIRSEKRRVIALSGRKSYYFLKAGYLYKRWLNDRQVAHSNLILCGSRWAKERWVASGVPAEAVEPLPYPYDLERFRTDVLPGGGPEIEFLCLGRIVPRKRVDLLIDAVKIARRTRPEIKATIIGRFAYAQGFETLIRGLSPADGVEYRESIDRAEVPALLAKVDAVIQPSEAENLGSSVIEGLAAGRPAIVGPTNGTADYVGPSSIVFDAYTPESVASAMIRMADALRSDPARLAADARAAAERFVRLDRVVDRLLETVEAAKRRFQRVAPSPPSG